MELSSIEISELDTERLLIIVDIFSPIGILIILIGLVLTVGFPVAMIKFGRKS